MDSIKGLDVSTLILSVVYYVVIFTLADLSRRLVDTLFRPSSLFHVFCIEAIGTATVCICVFENGFIIGEFGMYGFFVAAAATGYCFGAFNRGAFGNPMAPTEMLIHKEISFNRYVTVVAAQLLAGWFAFRTTVTLWGYLLPIFTMHVDVYANSAQGCKINFQQPYVLMALFELVGTFSLRAVIPKMPQQLVAYLAPVFIASIFTFSILFVGDAALDPVVGSTLFFGCTGLTLQWFALHYWILPMIGWMLAAKLDRSQQVKKEKSEKKNKNKAKKAKKE